MRVERLVIEAGDRTFTLDLHPRLTVVAGIGELERQSLVGELVGALGGSRSGVHVELERRDGRHLAVFRPTTGAHRIVDVDQARDVTADLGGASCDLLQPLGLDPASARQLMRLGVGDLAADGNRDHAVKVLAGLEQERLWAAADALVAAEAELRSEAEAVGSAPEDAALIEEVENRHIAVERAAAQLEATRKRTFWIGGVAAAATLPAVMAGGAMGLLFAAVAIISVLASLVARARLIRAGRAEEAALAHAGASSYLGFQIQRVDGLLGDGTSRRVLVGAASAHRGAVAVWERLAGDIPVAWALAQREEVQAAARLRDDVDALGALSGTVAAVDVDLTNDLVHVLVSRLAAARSVGGEGVPIILDDPFRDVEASVKPLLLELIGRAAGRPQVVLLTEDEDVASWARLEALTGEVALVEPDAGHAAAPRPAPAAASA